MKRIKTCAAVHDLSGLGKCSLTVVLPILSAAGIETSVIPTALFSNHTAFPSFHKRDLTGDMMPIVDEWKKIGVRFDAVYSGFLGSIDQINIVSDIIDTYAEDDNLILVDPVMGDGGRLYTTITDEMAEGMKKLCSKADIIVPNLTEACRMLGIEYREGPHERKYIEDIMKGLSLMGVKYAVLTGIFFDEENLGTACIDGSNGEISYCMTKKYSGMFHGTGDIFASVLLAKLLNGKNISEAMRDAVDFTSRAIANTVKENRDRLLGVAFEPELHTLFCEK